ncbi:TetR/AcrR family transcriptional regulator [Bdellovibrio bacteriovorus]|uniref:TetR/AcrR family transcriptional regulator n=1 Tax=Bdellovibrio bacteriovorus TaxID=959 RepID=UPI0035A612B3
MGRNRNFDMAEARASARDLFLKRGFEGPSIEEICHAIGINKPSFYRFFVSKEALYFDLISEFSRLLVQRLKLFDLAQDADRGLESFFDDLILTYSQSEAKGCFLYSTLPLLAATNEQAENALAFHQDHVVLALQKESGFSVQRARRIAMLIPAVSALVRAGYSRQSVRQFVKDHLDLCRHDGK